MNLLDLNKFIDAVGNKYTTRDEIINTLKHHLAHKSGRRTIANLGITTQDKARRILQEFRLWRDEYSTPYSDDYVLHLVINADNETLPFVPFDGYKALIHNDYVLTSDQIAAMNVAGLRAAADAGKLLHSKSMAELEASVDRKLADITSKTIADLHESTVKIQSPNIQVKQGVSIDDIAQSVAYAINGNTSEAKANIQRVFSKLREASKGAACAMAELGMQKPVEPVTIEGVTADQHIDVDRIWQRVLEHQEQADAKHEAKKCQVITINEVKPFAIAYFSDFHVGSGGVNYKALKNDIKTVDETEGFWSEFHGDAVDNWIVGKLQGLERGQLLNFDEEWGLFLAILEMMQPKLLWVVSGNHDNWSFKVGGADRIRQALQGKKILYDTDEVNVTVKLGDASWRHKIRHKTRYNSIFNKSHGIERDLERGGDDFDIGVAGHTHVGTFFREFPFQNKMRLAILTGAYKRHDAFQREIGFAPTTHDGCGAVIYMPDGSLLPVQNIQLAAKVLTALRAEYE